MALADATGNQTYISHALTYVRNAFKIFTKDNIVYEGCDETNTCAGDGLAFRGLRVLSKRYYFDYYFLCIGVFYLGLARLYERTRDDQIAQVIEASYHAMLEHVSILYKFMKTYYLFCVKKR